MINASEQNQKRKSIEIEQKVANVEKKLDMISKSLSKLLGVSEAEMGVSCGDEESKNQSTFDLDAKDEFGITPSHIEMVMQSTACTREEAIKALRESNNGMIGAALKLSAK